MDETSFSSRFDGDVFRFTYPATYSASELTQALKAGTELLLTWGPRPFALVVDVSRSIKSSAETREAARIWMQDQAAHLRAHCYVGVWIARNKVVQGAITAVFWFYPPPCPHHIVSDPGEVLPIIERARPKAT